MSLNSRVLHFGHLEMVEVYDYYDRPILFSCRNAVGIIYLVTLSEETRGFEAWLYVAMSEDRFRHVRSGAIDLYTSFLDSEDEVVFRVVIPYSEDPVTMEPLEARSLDPSVLPLPGEFIMLPTETLPRFEESLSLESRRVRRDLLKLAFKLPSRLRNEAPAKFLGQVLTAAQDVVSAIAQSLDGMIGRRGSLVRKMLDASELAVVGVGASSFEVKFASGAANLFGRTAATEALDEFVKLLQIGGDPAPLQAELKRLQPRVAADYLLFLRSLDNQVESARAVWATPNRETETQVVVSAATVRAAITVIEAEHIESREEESVTGRLSGASITKKTFELRTGPKKKEQIGGDVADEAMASVNGAVINELYTARIERTQTVKMATGEVVGRVTLLGLTPVGRVAGN